MLLDAVLAYLHFAALFVLIWFLARQWSALAAGVYALDPHRLVRMDSGFGWASLAVLATGVGRLMYGAKPTAFYLHNPVLYTKVGLFLAVGLISIAPTRRFLQWRRQRNADPAFTPTEAQWRQTRRWVSIELHLLAIVPLLAALMARAIGYRA